MGIVTVSSKGEIVIPKEIRDALGIKERDKLLILQKGDSILLKKMNIEKKNKK